MNLAFVAHSDGFDLQFEGHLLLRHRFDCPSLVMARGQPRIEMVLGNFRIEDNPTDSIVPLQFVVAGSEVTLRHADRDVARFSLCGSGLTVEALEPGFDRLVLSFHAEAGECVWGGGEQMSYLALNGRRFPMWTSEPGVGRDKSTRLTRLMDEQAMAGGDYWNTNYPQPTFLTSRWLAIHLDESCYSVLDFSDTAAHRVEVWSSRARFEFFAAVEPAALVGKLSERFGRQPALPDWAISGAIVGLKSGESSFDRLERFIEAGTSISGLWCEDWAGVRETSFGRRLFWDWQIGSRSEQRYPALGTRIAALKARGIRFLAYANPYLAVDGELFAEAAAGGHFALRQDSDEPYLVEFGEFECGVVDFTRVETRAWFAERVLSREMLDKGSTAGWPISASIFRSIFALQTGRIRWRRIIAGRCCGLRSMLSPSACVAGPAMPCSSCGPDSRGFSAIARCSGQAISQSISPGTTASVR